MQLNQENMFDYTPTEWRFSGIMPQFYGLDPVIVVALPALFLGLSRGFGTIYFILLALFTAICVYVGFFTTYQTVTSWLHSLRTRYLQRCQWETGE
jgi:hypothetical protein